VAIGKGVGLGVGLAEDRGVPVGVLVGVVVEVGVTVEKEGIIGIALRVEVNLGVGNVDGVAVGLGDERRGQASDF
jgi:hypothetical protein